MHIFYIYGYKQKCVGNPNAQEGISMTLQEIEAFLAVVQTGSLSAAAKSLYVTQPTLSRRLDSLESELGSRLVERNKGQRTVSLTATGRAMVPLAQKWQRLWAETGEVVRRGGVRAFEAGAIQTLCAYVMPRAFAHFFARGLPQQLTMGTLHSPEAYDAVESGSVDAAFVANTRHSELVSAVPVFEDPFVLVCAQDAPYHDGIAPSELDGALSINLEASHEYQLWHHYWFGATGQAAVADNFVLVEQILTMPGFWSIAPLTAARGSATHRGLRIVRISDAPPNRTIYMLTRGPATALATMLMDDVRSAAEQFIG